MSNLTSPLPAGAAINSANAPGLTNEAPICRSHNHDIPTMSLAFYQINNFTTYGIS